MPWSRALYSVTALALLVVGCSDDASPALSSSSTRAPAVAPPTTTNEPAPATPALVTPPAIYEQTDSGARAAAGFFMTSAIYFLRTGDKAPLDRVTSDTCRECAMLIEDFTAMRDEGRYEIELPTITGAYTIDERNRRAERYWVISLYTPAPTLTRADGSRETQRAVEQTLGITTHWVDGSWRVGAFEPAGH